MALVLKPGALRSARESAALTQRDLAALAGTTAATINRLEHGHQAQPSTVRKIAAALGIKPSDLVAAQ